jgi:hypothetical protein
MDGRLGLGEPAITGVHRARIWDAVASAHAPNLFGETIVFVVLPDGTVVLEDDQPDDSLAPLADAIDQRLSPPYRAAAVRSEGSVWSAAAERIVIVELPWMEGDVIDLSVVDGVRELSVDDKTTIRPIPALDVLAEEHAQVALHAERVDGDLFAVDVFPL